MSYNYDPASEFSDGGEVALSYEEQQANSIARGAGDYKRHINNTITPGVNDLQLLEIQRQAAAESNPLKKEALYAKAAQMASQSVSTGSRGMGAVQTSDPNANIEDSPMTSTYGQLSFQYGKQELDGALAYGRDQLDEESANLLNADLTSDDLEKAAKAVRVLLYMQENNINTLRK